MSLDMSEQSAPDQEGPESPASTPAPHTGHRLVDAALVDFGGLDQHPPADHHAALSQVQEVLASVLENRHSGAQTTIPGTPMPRPQWSGSQ